MEQLNSTLFDMVIDTDTRDFQATEGMETAVNVQLFTDQRVTRQEIARPRDRQGWIGDMLTRNESYQIGSLLHLQKQARDIPVENNEAAAYAKNALEYFITIGASKEVTAVVVGKNIEGEIINDADDIIRYSRLWKAPLCEFPDRPRIVSSIEALLTDEGEKILTDKGEVITTFTKREVF